MQKNTKKIDEKIRQISLTYNELKKSQIYEVKKNLIKTLRRLCNQGLAIIDKQNSNPQITRKRKQIEEMLKNCQQIQNKIQEQFKDKAQNSLSKSSINLQLIKKTQNPNRKSPQDTEQQNIMRKSRQVMKSIIFYEIQSKQLKLKNQQIDELAKRFQRNNQIMEQIRQMVIQQGEDIDVIQQNIKQTYQKVKDANLQLENAAEMQKKNRLLKIRLGVSGLLGALGMKILGIPGLIFGFFGGLIATK